MKIVCGVDFSPPSEAAIRTAARLAARLGDSLVLVHALPPSYAEEVLASADSQPFGRGLAERAREVEHAIHAAARTRLGALAGLAGVAAETRVTEGRPSEALARIAGEVDARLIVVGTHGRPAPTRWFLGSVAERTLRDATRPVLVARGEERFESAGPLRVLVAYDFGAPSERAAAWARELEEVTPCEVAFAHAYWPPVEAQRFGLGLDIEEGNPEIDRRVEESLRREPWIGPTARLLVRPSWGRAADVIANLAKQEAADLLVVGTRGAQGIDLLRGGAFALSLVRRSPIPVVSISSSPARLAEAAGEARP